jgi:rhodanese-related sulfurtransferase
MVATISRDELKSKIDRRDKFSLLDVLAEDYFRRSHLPGAVNVPMDRVKELAPKLVPDKNADVVVYCMNKL